jgi:hypothetical protein
MTTDANTYYLNQHMGDIDADAQRRDNAQWIATQEMADPKSDFYPWTPSRITDAFNEAPSKDLQRMAAAHGNDRELAVIVREIVLGYWLETATEHFYDQGE